MSGHIKGLAHIAIHTKDLQESAAFYEKLGGVLQDQGNVSTPAGEKHIALVSFAGTTLELIQSPTLVPLAEGNIPHIALLVDDLDAVASEVQAAGIDFLTPEPKTLPDLFGGLRNWFFAGPSGEQIELMQRL